MFKSEAELVDWLKKVCKGRPSGLAVGIGDDTAVIRPGRGQEVILTTDLTIEGVHFLRRLHPARSVGHRAMARALSDVAAMGGRARYALLSMAISRRTRRRWVEDFYAGARTLASRAGVTIVGGDTSLVRGAGFADVVVAGEVPRGTACLRAGARPGDRIYVSGCLGLSALGLRMLKAVKSPVLHWRDRRYSGPLRAHLYPQPRLELGWYLRKNRLVSAMMDLSDGLSTDLARLCRASGVGAVLVADQIPRPLAAARFKLNQDALLSLALNGGEDYELLFTVPARKAEGIPDRFRGVPLTCIGEVRRAPGIFLTTPTGEMSLRPGGYEHFRIS